MKKMFKVFCLICLVQNIISLKIINPRNGLHHFMDDEELSFYFGSMDIDMLPDYQVIDVPTVLKNLYNEDFSRETQDDNIQMHFTAFDFPVSLRLSPNKKLISPHMQVVRVTEDGLSEETIFDDDENESKPCHYLHSDNNSVAAVSNCQNQEINGLIFLPHTTLEIQPLTSRLRLILKSKEVAPLVDTNAEYGGSGINLGMTPHIIKRIYSPKPLDIVDRKNLIIENLKRKRSNYFVDLPREENSVRNLADRINQNTENDTSSLEMNDKLDWLNELSGSRDENLKNYQFEGSRKITVEVGLFFDEPGYRLFAPFFSNNERKMRDMLLAYMNGVQALYHHPSLGTQIDITIVYMELMKTQPIAMRHYGGERSQLLDSFCEYQKKINPPDDNNPKHWDMGLYVSGLDFYAYENGRKSGVTMGLATVGGVCLEQYACVIAEFGTTNVFGKPYPSAGFTSVYILSHEIGHNLGMHHDSSGNSCPKEGYVMSPSRGTQGETTWSSCSADVIDKLNWAKCLFDKPPTTPAELNAWKYKGLPGQSWTSKKQCEVLLRDDDAIASPSNGLESICQNLHCRTPHRTGYYFAGPALEGTDCGPNTWCEGGQCIVKRSKPIPLQVSNGGWSLWKSEKCKSGCMLKSKGFQMRKRTCTNPVPVNTDEGCDGNAFDIILCKDDQICAKKKRQNSVQFASNKCKEFSKLLPELDPSGRGLQAPHEPIRLWMGCAIFCRRHDTGSYYTPRFDLNDMGVDSYFPDGTWCHSDGSQNYYCLHHHCLPDNFQFTKTSIWLLSEDVPLPGNAYPERTKIPDNLLNYLSIDSSGRPLSTHLNIEDFDIHGDWTNKDYLELPEK